MGPQEPFQHSEQDREKHMDYSTDHVARVRAAKEAAIREMEAFGDPSEYDVVLLQGQLKEEPAAETQESLRFQDDSGGQQKGDD